MYDEKKAKETLEWCLVTGRGDEKFIKKRDDMISAASGEDPSGFMSMLQEMLKHDDSAHQNLLAADQEQPGSPMKWSKAILNIGSLEHRTPKV